MAKLEELKREIKEANDLHANRIYEIGKKYNVGIEQRISPIIVPSAMANRNGAVVNYDVKTTFENL